jgi:hypothetical protein
VRPLCARFTLLWCLGCSGSRGFGRIDLDVTSGGDFGRMEVGRGSVPLVNIRWRVWDGG